MAYELKELGWHDEDIKSISSSISGQTMTITVTLQDGSTVDTTVTLPSSTDTKVTGISNAIANNKLTTTVTLSDNTSVTSAAVDLPTVDVAGKLDKVTTTTITQQAYVKNADGTQEMIDLYASAVPNTMVLRDGQGRSKVADGVADDDIATVGQMNTAIAAAQPYHTEVNNLGITILQEEYNGLIADKNSYFVVAGNDTYRYNYQYTNGDSEWVYGFSGGENGTIVVELTPDRKLSLPITRSENVSNKKTSITGTGNDTDYPTTKAVVDYVAANAGTAYHIELSGNSGTITTEQYNALLADNDSYILHTVGVAVMRLARAVKVDGSGGSLQYQKFIGGTARTISIEASGAWTKTETTYQSESQLTTTLSSSSTDTQYPSAKATYDADQATLTAAKEYADSILGTEQAWLQKISTGEGV